MTSTQEKAVVPVEETKYCKRCKIEKSINEFWRDKKNKDGRRTLCRVCEPITRREHRALRRRLDPKLSKFSKSEQRQILEVARLQQQATRNAFLRLKAAHPDEFERYEWLELRRLRLAHDQQRKDNTQSWQSLASLL